MLYLVTNAGDRTGPRTQKLLAYAVLVLAPGMPAGSSPPSVYLQGLEILVTKETQAPGATVKPSPAKRSLQLGVRRGQGLDLSLLSATWLCHPGKGREPR